jgi:hypothetical protein
MMAQPLAPPISLLVHRAFVVAFHADADLQADRVIGRAERVVSGRATSFQSQGMLMAFMVQGFLLLLTYRAKRSGRFFSASVND